MGWWCFCRHIPNTHTLFSWDDCEDNSQIKFRCRSGGNKFFNDKNRFVRPLNHILRERERERAVFDEWPHCCSDFFTTFSMANLSFYGPCFRPPLPLLQFIPLCSQYVHHFKHITDSMSTTITTTTMLLAMKIPAASKMKLYTERVSDKKLLYKNVEYPAGCIIVIFFIWRRNCLKLINLMKSQAEGVKRINFPEGKVQENNQSEKRLKFSGRSWKKV